jgi:hypothetical protein
LQNVKLFAEVLDGTEKALRVLNKRDQNSQRKRARNHADAADPVEQRHAAHAQKFYSRIKVGKRVNRILVCFHVDAVQFGEFDSRFLFAIEKLNHGHPADVFLQKAVNAGDGSSNIAVCVAHVIPEHVR